MLEPCVADFTTTGIVKSLRICSIIASADSRLPLKDSDAAVGILAPLNTSLLTFLFIPTA